MTIINSFVQGARAYLLTDMAWIDRATGKVLVCASKFIQGTNFPWAAAATGDAHLIELLNQLSWCAPSNADEMAECLPRALRGVQAVSADPAFTMAVRLAAWCGRTRSARCFHIDSDSARAAAFGIDAWTVVEPQVLIPGDSIVSALPDLPLQDPAAIMDRRRFDPARDGRRVVAAQREHVRFPLKGQSEPMALIGCGAQLACISRKGVTIRTLRTWPEDRPGELIALDAVPAA